MVSAFPSNYNKNCYDYTRSHTNNQFSINLSTLNNPALVSRNARKELTSETILLSSSSLLASTSESSNNNQEESSGKCTKIYFDIGLDLQGRQEIVGRLVFCLDEKARSFLPLHVENLIKLSTGAMQSIDSRLAYTNCKFRHSPQFVEGFSQYRWAHTLDGRGRNAVGISATERLSASSESLRLCTNSIYGGVYYGLQYREDDMTASGQYGVMLTVPLVGPSRGSTGFSIVRVGESPQEWKERLLLNSAVLGYLDSGIDALHRMARQTDAPPTVVASGLITE